ncbi:MAG: hypothetical protein JWM12_62 [Ilumatobacteraceae bacterium]|jgi:uncharacterized protein YfaP (DUF2135 family)|nr:hypothetical protein [Ilumatobacteraceae bacterium]
MNDADDLLLDDDAADLLLAELGEALAEEITDERLAGAVNAFWVARTDALIAEVEEHLDAGQRAGVRGGTNERQHLYRLDAFSVSLTVDSIDRRVTGRIDGASSSARWLDANGASRPLKLDEDGGFRVSPQSGPASVEVVLADGRRVRTTWTLL